MDIALIYSTIGGIWIIGLVLFDIINYSRYKNRKLAILGRTVRLDESFCKSHSISRYGIINKIADERKRRILSVEVKCYPTAGYIKRAKEAYDKQYEGRMQTYKEEVARYNALTQNISPGQLQQYQQAAYQLSYNPGYQQYYQQFEKYQAPYKPNYDFTSTSGEIYLTVKKSLTKLMPKNFDIQTENVIKPISKGKEVTTRRTMPRIFKYLLLLALVIFIFSLVTTIDSFMPTIFSHWFIKK